MISHGQQRATIVEVGGGLRRYRIGERDLLHGYTRAQRCTGARGLPLVPWPNRIQDERYVFDGIEYQVPLTEQTATTRFTVSCAGATGPAGATTTTPW